MMKKERLHAYATALAIMISILHPQLESCRLEEKQAAGEVQADSGYKVLVMAVERLGKEMDRLHARLDSIAKAQEEESRLTSKTGGGPGTTSAVAPDKWLGPTETTVTLDEPPSPASLEPKSTHRRLPRSLRKAQQAVQRGDISLD